MTSLEKLKKNAFGGSSLLATVFSLPTMVVCLFAIADFVLNDHPFKTSLQKPSSALQLYGMRGQTIHFEMQSSGIASNWASPTGFRLTLKESDSKDSIDAQVSPAKNIDWGDRMQYSSRASHEFTIPASFTVPSLPGADTRRLAGFVTGTLIVPRGAVGAVHEFSNVECDLDVAVNLEIASQDRHRQLWWDYEGLLLVAFFGSLILFSSGIILFLWWEPVFQFRLQSPSTPILIALSIFHVVSFVALHIHVWTIWMNVF